MTVRGASRPTTDLQSTDTTAATAWQDLALGMQLTLQGGRASWVRLTLTAVGIGLCTAVLLLAASLGPALDSRQSRVEALVPQYLPTSGQLSQGRLDPVSLAVPGSFEVHESDIPYRGTPVHGIELSALPQTIGVAPRPPGVDRFPAPGELVVSPALAELLTANDAADLRIRLSGDVVGTISPAALQGPQELRFYRGAEPTSAEPVRSIVATGWGLQQPAPPEASDRYLPALLLAGTTIIIVPLLIFVWLMSRLGGPARDRRSAAIRLVGASADQLRRITLAETGLAAACGLLLGGLGYVVARLAAPWLKIGSAAFFPSDLVPTPTAAVAIVLLVPAAALGAAFVGLRRVVTEPLGVVRGRADRRRRPWWGLGLLVFGGLTMVGALYSGVLTGRPNGLVLMSVGIVTMLLSAVVLLPWALQRMAAYLPTGGVAWQIAVRRLQLDSTTPAQVIAGICVVLAGAIALQPMLTLLGTDRTGSGTGAHAEITAEQPGYRIFVSSPTAAELTAVVDGVAHAQGMTRAVGGLPLGGTVGATAPFVPGEKADMTGVFIASVASCGAIPEVPDCRDGQVYVLAPNGVFDAEQTTQAAATVDRLRAGGAVTLHGAGVNIQVTLPPMAGTLPADPYRFENGYANVLLTPGALGGDADALLDGISLDLRGIADHPSSAVADQLRTTMADLTWRASVETTAEGTGSRAEFTSTARTGLLIAAVLTLLVAVTGLLVMTIDQLADRRRALTLTIASGVPRGVIARSLIIGAGIPILVGVLLAAVIGTGLSAFLLTLLGETWQPDWAALGLYAAAAVLTVAVTMLALLPVLARVTRLDAIRTG